jgi:hypothetical protein
MGTTATPVGLPEQGFKRATEQRIGRHKAETSASSTDFRRRAFGYRCEGYRSLSKADDRQAAFLYFER